MVIMNFKYVSFLLKCPQNCTYCLNKNCFEQHLILSLFMMTQTLEQDTVFFINKLWWKNKHVEMTHNEEIICICESSDTEYLK